MYNNSTSAKRVSNRELRRRATRSIQEGSKVYALLLTVLAQSGGEIVVTKGTIDQVGMNLLNLGYVVVGGKEENEFIVRLTEGKTEIGTEIAPSAIGETV